MTGPNRAGATGVRRAGWRLARLAVVLGTAGVISGCTDWAGYDLDSFWGRIPALSTMRTSVAYDAHDMPRLPAEGTIPVQNPNGDVPGRFTQMQLDSVGATLTNPFGAAPQPTVMARGEVVYQRQCAVCHGPQGEGTGPVVGPGKYPFAPGINIPATAARSDGYLYAIIVAGRGLMPPYGHALTHEDRWAIVSYVRQLQSDAGASPAAAAGTPAAGTPPASLDVAGADADTAAAGIQP